MNASTLKAWFGQVTTGIGALIGLPVVIALLSGQITVRQAIPALVAAVIGLVWPENKALAASAQAAAGDLVTLIPQLVAAFEAGLNHGVAIAPMPAPAPQPNPATPNATPAANDAGTAAAKPAKPT